LERAQPLGGIPRQRQVYAAGDPQGDEAAREAFSRERRNFLALMFCLMLGTAAMPHILMRCYTTPSPQAARRSVSWSLLFIVLLYISAPALAVMVKYEVFSNLVGLPFDQLPGWIQRWSRLDSSLVSVEDINGDGLLQFGELRLGGDVIVLAAPEIGGLPTVVSYLVAAGGLAAALSTADGLLLTIANAGSHDIYYRLINPHASAIRRVVLSKVLVLMVALLAAFIAALKLANILQLVTAAFSLAAAAFFPALVLGIFWRRANRVGATLGMLSGLGVCLWYMVTTVPWLRQLFGVSRPIDECLWWGIDPLSAGVFGVPTGFAVAVIASLLTRPPSAQEVAVIDQVRYPEAVSGGAGRPG
jgi:cation/acetate symporter